MPIMDVILITEKEFPFVFKAFEMIAHDNGAQAGHTNFAISMSWKSTIGAIEDDLKALHEEADLDFETLCIGERDLQREVVINRRLTLADKLLQEFFEEI
jgi:hypothetical protein